VILKQKPQEMSRVEIGAFLSCPLDEKKNFSLLYLETNSLEFYAQLCSL